MKLQNQISFTLNNSFHCAQFKIIQTHHCVECNKFIFLHFETRCGTSFSLQTHKHHTGKNTLICAAVKQSPFTPQPMYASNEIFILIFTCLISEILDTYCVYGRQQWPVFRGTGRCPTTHAPHKLQAQQLKCSPVTLLFIMFI